MTNTLLALLAVCVLSHLGTGAPPNLVIIFTDDQRHDAVGYAGNDAIHSPNLDRLAKQGLVFTNAFVNTSICAVSRANLMMGQYPHRHGVDDFHKTLSPEQLTKSVPGRLRDAGYQTAFFGKWGIGDSAARTALGATVFDYWAGQPKQTNFFHDADCRYVTSDGFARPLKNLCDCPADAHASNLLQPVITGNLFYQTDPAVSWTGMKLRTEKTTAYKFLQISNNTFHGDPKHRSPNTGLHINAASAGAVNGNVFSALDTGIRLGKQATDITPTNSVFKNTDTTIAR